MADRDAKTTTVVIARALTWVVYAFVLVSQLILAQGFILHLLGANPGSAYVDWAYRSLERVMSPFRGIFEPIEIAGDAVLDTSILFAMVIYGIALLALQALLDWMARTIVALDEQHRIDVAVEHARRITQPTVHPGDGGSRSAPDGSVTPPPAPPAP